MIVITGASKGIGKFLFESFLSEKEKVYGTFLSSRPDWHEDKYVKLNVCDFEQINKFVQEKRDILSDLTLINCAGITYNGFTHKSDPEKWRHVIDTNLIGSYNFIRALLPILRLNKSLLLE